MKLVLFILSLLLTGTSAVLKPKFESFYPKYGYVFRQAAQRCQPELDAYHSNLETASCRTPCACAADCLLSNLTVTQQANMASANVILGLTPAILVFVGPDLGEMAVVSTWCPFLGFILALASPAINIRRVLVRVNVLKVLEQQPDSMMLLEWHKWRQRMKPAGTRLTNILKYVAALVALANTVENSIRLDLRTVPSFRCGLMLLPLAWSLLGVLVYLFAAVGVRLRKGSLLTKCTWKDLRSSEDSVFSEVFFRMGSLVSVALMILGVADLSSLLFISANDAINVLMRYMVSSIICQIVFASELASLQLHLSQP